MTAGTITQRVSPTDPVVGPYFHDHVAYSSNVQPTGDTRTMGRYVQFDCGGTNEVGGVYADFVCLRHLQASNAGDHQALTGIAHSYAANIGPGELFGINAAAYAHAGCTTAGINGAEFDVGIDAGAVVQHRFGVNVINDGALVAVNQDAAYSIMSCVAGGGFKAGWLLSMVWGQPPIAPTGSVLLVDGAQTVQNVLNLTDLTVTGHIIKHANVKLTGDGELTLAKPVHAPFFQFANTVGIYSATGAPSFGAVKGSLYLRTDGSGPNNRMYINTDNNTGWTPVQTLA